MTIVHPRFVGTVINVSGRWGAGKTTMLLTFEDPSQVDFIDGDQKSEARARGLKVHGYYSPASMELPIDPTDTSPELALEWVRDTFKRLKENYAGQTTIAIDNGSYLEKGWGVAVAKDPRRYGVNPKHAQTGSYGGINPGIGEIWQAMTAILFSIGYKHILVATHMSDVWANDQPIGKYKVKGNHILTQQLSALSLVLVRPDRPHTPPRGLVGKEALSPIEFEGGKFHVSTALPPAIPACDWEHINDYLDTFKGRLELTPEEAWTSRELDRYGPWLSSEQREFILSLAKNPILAEVDEGQASGKLDDAARLLQKAAVPHFETREELEADIRRRGWNLAQAMGALKKEFGAFNAEKSHLYIPHLEVTLGIQQ